jgi:hypothetical protein
VFCQWDTCGFETRLHCCEVRNVEDDDDDDDDDDTEQGRPT